MDRAGHLGPFHAVPLGLVMPALCLPSAQKGGLRGGGRRAAQQVAELRHGWWCWGHPEAAIAAACPPGAQPGSAGGGGALLLLTLVLFLSSCASELSSPLCGECGFLKNSLDVYESLLLFNF